MPWVPLKETPLIKLLQKLATLQTSVLELIAKEKLNNARARILSTRGLQLAQIERKKQPGNKDGKN